MIMMLSFGLLSTQRGDRVHACCAAGGHQRGDQGDAFVFWDERGFQRRVSYSQLTSEVSRAAQALAQLGLRPGDRVAAFIPNMPETGMLALWDNRLCLHQAFNDYHGYRREMYRTTVAGEVPR